MNVFINYPIVWCINQDNLFRFNNYLLHSLLIIHQITYFALINNARKYLKNQDTQKFNVLVEHPVVLSARKKIILRLLVKCTIIGTVFLRTLKLLKQFSKRSIKSNIRMKMIRITGDFLIIKQNTFLSLKYFRIINNSKNQ